MKKEFNVVWQTLIPSVSKSKGDSKAWKAIKWLIKVAVFAWRILKFLDDGDAG